MRPPGPNGPFGTEDPVRSERPVRAEDHARPGGTGGRRWQRPACRGLPRSARASITARISQALVEIPSAAAISSTFDFDRLRQPEGDPRDRLVLVASASAASPWARCSSPASGSSRVGSVSAVCTDDANSGSWPTIRSSTEEGASSALMVAGRV